MTSRAWGCLLSLLATYALALHAFGCGNSSRGSAPTAPAPARTSPAPAPAPTVRHAYPSSFTVPAVPPGSWVRSDVYVCTAAVASFSGALGLAEVDSTEATRDPRIAAWGGARPVGLPPGWRLVVLPAGPFTSYPDGVTPTLVHGCAPYGLRTIYASLPESPALGRVFRVLAHELGHGHLWEITQDAPLATANDHPSTPIPSP